MVHFSQKNTLTYNLDLIKLYVVVITIDFLRMEAIGQRY